MANTATINAADATTSDADAIKSDVLNYFPLPLDCPLLLEPEDDPDDAVGIFSFSLFCT